MYCFHDAIRHSSLFVAILWLTAACSPVQSPVVNPTSGIEPTLAATATTFPTQVATTATTEDAVLAGIQETLNRYVVAVRAEKNESIDALIDPNGPIAIRRLMQDLGQGYRQQSAFNVPNANLRVQSWTLRTPEVAEAVVQRTWDERLHVWLFRKHADTWLFTAPTDAELGETLTLSKDLINLTYRAWDKELAAELLPELIAGAQRVQETLGVTQMGPITVVLQPQLSAASTLQKGEYKRATTPDKDTILLFTFGLSFGSFYPWEAFPQSVATVFRHEYTHRVNDRATTLVPLSAMPTWMSEGLAEHVSGEDHLAVPEFRLLAADDSLMSICDLVSPPTEISAGILYGTAQQATTFIIEAQGGLQAFWRLAEAYRKTPGGGVERMSQALQTGLGRSCSDFDREWHAWSAQRAANWTPLR